MELAEIRKGVIAVLGALVAVIPQVLSSLAGVIPANVASYLTIIASVATAALVYLVPNSPSNALEKLSATADALGPMFEMVRGQVQREVAARLPSSSPRVQASVRQPESVTDPFVVRGKR